MNIAGIRLQKKLELFMKSFFNMPKIILKEPFLTAWQNVSVFKAVNKIKGTIAKAKDNRRVVRFEFDDDIYYLKHHKGIGWLEVFKNLTQGKLPVLGAQNEWDAIDRLSSIGIDVMDAVAFGRHGFNPANQESFLITKELKKTLSLESLCKSWPAEPPPYKLKKLLIEKVAVIARLMRENGINHRDFYLCHMLLDVANNTNDINEKNMKLYLVDLHRVQIRSSVPNRWLVKDIGSLYYSAADIGLTKRDIVRFLRVYDQKPVRSLVESDFLQAVHQRALNLYKKDYGKVARFPL